jgi:hypothetical protein
VGPAHADDGLAVAGAVDRVGDGHVAAGAAVDHIAAPIDAKDTIIAGAGLVTTNARNAGMNDTAHRAAPALGLPSAHEPSSVKLPGASAVNATTPVGEVLAPLALSLTVTVHRERCPTPTLAGEHLSTVLDEPAAITDTTWLPPLGPCAPSPP